MNPIDTVIAISIGAGFVLGLFRGFVKEVIALVAIFLGIYGAKFLSPWFASVLINVFSVSEKMSQPLAYIILFLAIVIILLILAKMIDKLFEAASLGGLNRFLGGLFGGLKVALIVSVLLNVFDVFDAKLSIVKPETKEKSTFYKPLIKAAPQLWNEIKERYQHDNNADNENGFNKEI